MQPGAPSRRRGWRTAIPLATALATIAASTGAASAQDGGGVGSPSAGETPTTGAFKLTAAEATPHRTYFDARRKPRVSYVFSGAAADRRPGRGRRPRDPGGGRELRRAGRAPERRERRHLGRASSPTAPRRPTATTSSGSADAAGGATRDHHRGRASATTSTASRSTPATATATASAPAATTRARTCSRSAGARSAPLGAAGCRPTTSNRRPATTSSSTARRPSSTPSTPTWPSPRRCSPATGCAPGR